MKSFLCKIRKDLKINSNNAFTLAEVLITLGIIGIVASLTIPNLIQSYQERQMVTGLLKFNSTLQQAVQRWKEDIGCYSGSKTCLKQQNLADQNCSNFDQIAKFLKIRESATGGVRTQDWLPKETLDYYGDSQVSPYGGVSKATTGGCLYLMQDGTAFIMDVDPDSFDITVDVNGKKPPNRVGKDTFKITIGGKKDIEYYPRHYTATYDNGAGLCGYTSNCDSNNTNPTISNGASPTAYVISNHKLPDFKALSQIVPGFKP